MGTETMSVGRANPDEVTVVRAGGLAALTLGMSYVLITALYAVSGAVPDGGGEAWLDYLDGSTAAWCGIVGLSVLTDVLFIPVALALYVALRTVDRNLMLAGVGLLGLFLVPRSRRDVAELRRADRSQR